MEKNKTSIFEIILAKRYSILLNALIVGIITALVTLFVHNKYKSNVSILIPSENSMGLGGILNDLPVGNFLPFSGISSNIDNIVGIIESRSVKDYIIQKFNIDSVYDFNGKYYEDLIEEFEDNISIDIDYDQSIIRFSFTDENSLLSSKIANHYIAYVDSIINILYGKKASKNKIFLGKRIEETKNKIDSMTLNIENFQLQNNVFLIPDQFQFQLENYANLKAQYDVEQIELKLIETTSGIKSNKAMLKLAKIKEIRNRLEGMIKGSGKGNIYEAAIVDFPKLSKFYYEMQFELRVKKTLLEYLYPQYEQAKLEEKKRTPNVIIIDNAVPAQKKSSPKRSLIVIAAVLFSVFVSTLTKYISALKENNQLDSNFYALIITLDEDINKIKRVFRNKKN